MVSTSISGSSARPASRATRAAVPTKAARRSCSRAEELATSLKRRHRDSRRKTRDGWLMDLGGNVFRAVSDSRKKLRLERILEGK
jgi:hypothetical protein